MKLLVTGNIGYITTEFIEEAFPECQILLLGETEQKSNRNKSLSVYPMPKTEEEFKDIFKTYEFEGVIYFSNYLWDHDGESDDVLLDGALTELRTILKAFRRAGVTAVLVTNELGSGIVPMEHVSRLYRDIMGRINQEAASEADEVYVSVCGITTEWKHRAVILPEVNP